MSATAFGQTDLEDRFGGDRGFGESCLFANDDNSSSAIDLTPAFPAGLRFFSDVHTEAFVNTNGNITFRQGVGAFTPTPFPIAAQPMIAPYWADADNRSSDGCGGNTSGCAHPGEPNNVWWHLEPGRFVVTWDEIGYYACHDDKRMSFQLLLTQASGSETEQGDFDVEFRFERCEWETGDASGGRDGFGGTPAQSGFDAGNLQDFLALPGSLEDGISDRMCRGSNVGEAGVWRFLVRSGSVSCEDDGGSCDTLLPGVCSEGIINCRNVGALCEQQNEPSDEICDSLDNDCDGATDEGFDCSFQPESIGGSGAIACASGRARPVGIIVVLALLGVFRRRATIRQG